MRKAYTFIFPVLLLTVLSVGLVFPVSATKGSYPGSNGKIAFAARDLDGVNLRIFVMDNDGSNMQQITDGNGFEDYDPCWSPDGTKIVFVRRDRTSFLRELWIINEDGSGLKPLSTGVDDFDPAWSPDGKKIAFSRSSEGLDIFVINADGTGSANLLISDGQYPSWSPDGTKIAYTTRLPHNINVADAATGSFISQVTTNGVHPCWSPDRGKIVFVRDYAIWVVNSDGSGEKKLTSPPISEDILDSAPNWSPDGNNIVFGRTLDSIMIMNADGTNLRDLTSDIDYDNDPDFQSIPLAAVGGVSSQINKLEILTPYLALAGLIITLSSVYVIRKRIN
ncbi:hypothetical protein [[Eubacterium] cellulosolvens]